jgi:NTE family protein
MKTIKNSPVKLGLVLSGGGAKGAFQQGVLEAFQKNGWLEKFDAISGVSIGALHAISLTSDKLDLSREIWETMDKNHAFHEEKTFFERLKKGEIDPLNHGLLPNKKLEELLDPFLEMSRISQKEVYIGITKLGSKNGGLSSLLSYNIKKLMSGDLPIEYIPIHTLKKETIKKTILASTAIPVVFKPVTIGEDRYGDGGVYNNTPIKPLIDAGCNKIVVIELFKYNLFRKKEIEGIPILTIAPDYYLGRVLDFDPEKSKEKMTYGHTFVKMNQKDIEHFIIG